MKSIIIRNVSPQLSSDIIQSVAYLKTRGTVDSQNDFIHLALERLIFDTTELRKKQDKGTL